MDLSPGMEALPVMASVGWEINGVMTAYGSQLNLWI
jgi:hypothetical protein